MTALQLHPVTRLLLWCNWVVAAFILPLAVIVASLPLILLGIDTQARRRWFGLAWRSRWLMAAILLAISLSVPGQYLIPGYPGTHEGVAAALEQIGRLLVTLAAVAWLLAAQRSELVAAIYGAGLALGGGRGARDLERFALRVLLVFELVEDRRIHWAELLAADSMDIGGGALMIELRSFSMPDRLINLLGVAVLLVVGVWGLR
ncbi:MAG TPA: hypothetical protein VIS73_02215 [Rhodocyclaceae bacterium]